MIILSCCILYFDYLVACTGIYQLITKKKFLPLDGVNCILFVFGDFSWKDGLPKNSYKPSQDLCEAPCKGERNQFPG